MNKGEDPFERLSSVLGDLERGEKAGAGARSAGGGAGEEGSGLAAATSRFEKLFQVTQAVATVTDPVELREQVLDLLLEAIGADRGTIFLRDARTGELVPRVVRNVDATTIQDATHYSRNILKRMSADPRGMLSYDTRGDDRFNRFESVAELEIRSFMCVPIRRGEEVLGTVYVDSRTEGKRFTEEDLAFLTAFIDVAGTQLHKAALYEAVLEENRALREEIDGRYALGNLIASSASMQPVVDLVRRVAGSDVTVLVEGETGTGKEVIARAIHHHGRRREAPFVAINCAAMPETLVESELFGHRRGAFTDAREDKRGLFEAAHGGTIFLDEVGELPLAVQAKLLRVLQEGEVTRVGESEPRRVDVRVISATNRDLQAEVGRGAFREDLFYRLNVVSIQLPPLRERPEDIPLLARHFYDRYCRRYGRRPGGLEPDFVAALTGYDWPGNVRQLENEIERAVALSEDGEGLGCALLSPAVRQAVGEETAAPGAPRVFLPGEARPLILEGIEAGERSLKARTEAFERALLLHELALHGGNKTAAARTLGLSRAGLNKKLNKLGLAGPDTPPDEGEEEGS